MSHMVTDAHRELLEKIQTGGESIDLVPGMLKGEEVIQVVEWLDNEDGDPLNEYRVLGVIINRPERIRQPELAA